MIGRYRIYCEAQYVGGGGQIRDAKVQETLFSDLRVVSHDSDSDLTKLHTTAGM
jgi:hypothetical protein